MERFKSYGVDDLVSKTFFLYFAFIHGALGFFLVTNDLSIYNSKVLSQMGHILPMPLWGFILLLSSSCFILSALQEGTPKFISMLISGLLGNVVFGLLAMASLELSQNQTNTVNYLVISSLDLLVAIMGGVILWIRRTSKTQKAS